MSKTDFWEGYVPEPDKRQQALDRMAENARELGLDYEPAQQEPTCKQDLQVWVQRTGQFSWEPQDERFWTRMQPAHHTEQHLEMVANQSAQQEPVPWSQALENVWAEPDEVFPPAQRTWVSLTDEETENFVRAVWPREATPTDYIRAIEAKLKEKNT